MRVNCLDCKDAMCEDAGKEIEHKNEADCFIGGNVPTKPQTTPPEQYECDCCRKQKDSRPYKVCPECFKTDHQQEDPPELEELRKEVLRCREALIDARGMLGIHSWGDVIKRIDKTLFDKAMSKD